MDLINEMKIQRERHFSRMIRNSVEYEFAYDSAAADVLSGEDKDSVIDRIAPISIHTSFEKAQGAVAGANQAARLIKLKEMEDHK